MDITRTGPDGQQEQIGAPAIACGSLEAAIAALPLLEQGKKPEEIVKELQGKLTEEQVSAPSFKVQQIPPQRPKQEEEADPAQELDQEIEEQLRGRYLMAKLRLITGQIYGLSNPEMDDISCVSLAQVAKYGEWKARKGY
ncbi:MAG TPA: hypothetical protein VGP72_16520 [Planctomycetota bacterium]|jgi:hypothetical protein